MQIPEEIETEANALKVGLAAAARVAETKLVADEAIAVSWLENHKAQLIGALVFVGTLIAVVMLARK
jgi:hypothetical protein